MADAPWYHALHCDVTEWVLSWTSIFFRIISVCTYIRYACGSSVTNVQRNALCLFCWVSNSFFFWCLPKRNVKHCMEIIISHCWRSWLRVLARSPSGYRCVCCISRSHYRMSAFVIRSNFMCPNSSDIFNGDFPLHLNLDCFTNWQQFIWYSVYHTHRVFWHGAHTGLSHTVIMLHTETWTMRSIYSIIFMVDWFKSFAWHELSVNVQQTRDSEHRMHTLWFMSKCNPLIKKKKKTKWKVSSSFI